MWRIRGSLLFVVVCLWRTQVAAATDYVADVQFLLDQFGADAASLLQTKGIDWNDVRREFGTAATMTASDEDHLRLVARLVGRLQDGHAAIIKSQVKWPDESRGRRFTGPRVALLMLPDRVLVRSSFKDAAAAGIHAGQEVLQIDGRPAREWLSDRVVSMRDRVKVSRPNRWLSMRPAIPGWPISKASRSRFRSETRAAQ